ncbi:LCP family protein required for cell wall assembly [Allocatelliglobosispora scoriae]|uniref:LCP family protein required for cell wall assembly n=1 Tax=Allocatelliglobosispora scoriae TaxID=643052 RepID=A0A841BV64_9ACTN|nr:LCP family protein [Allocatelliglobosispora scoriae]MBB5870803.1 LCP family protein required for cell wall assembly [Allocatelliglobosispora scoriae]
MTDASATAPPISKRRRWRRVVLVLLAIALLAGLGGYGALRYASRSYVNDLQRIPDPFVSIPASTRPSRTNVGMTLLVAGLDTESRRTRDGKLTTTEPQARSDVLMVVRISPDRSQASVISIPRDSWVEIPGHRKAKINASYAWGQAPLTVQTVERLTNLRIDHVAIIDWTGFRALTDAVGGVDVTIPADSHDSSQGVTFTKGTHHFDGTQALLYVRQRYGLPRGDIDRVQRQQNFLRLLMTQLLSKETLTDPAKLLGLLRAVSETVRVDSGFTTDDMLSLAADAPKLRTGVRFLTAPVAGLGREGTESVVYLNHTLGKPFWQAVKSDKLDAYVAKHGVDGLAKAPR